MKTHNIKYFINILQENILTEKFYQLKLNYIRVLHIEYLINKNSYHWKLIIFKNKIYKLLANYDLYHVVGINRELIYHKKFDRYNNRKLFTKIMYRI
jgi:hypothetical protein